MRKILTRTPEENEAAKQRRLAARAKLTTSYQLGYYVGEDLISRKLPTLNVDMLQTHTIIEVTPEEAAEAKRLNEVWFASTLAARNSANDVSEEWEALRAYHKMLEEKYLPVTLEVGYHLLNVTEENMTEFKKGLSSSLWDSDLSHYSTKLENITVEADIEGFFTTITLKREI